MRIYHRYRRIGCRTRAASSARAATRRRDSRPSATHCPNTAGNDAPGLLGSSDASVAAARPLSRRDPASCPADASALHRPTPALFAQATLPSQWPTLVCFRLDQTLDQTVSSDLI